MKCLCVPSSMIHEVWDAARPHLQRALDQTYGEYTIADVYASLFNGERQLHLIGDVTDPTAAAVTEVVDYPRRRAVRIHLLGGNNVNEWKDDFERHLLVGARNVRANQLEFIGRPGWARLFQHGDKRSVRVTVIKEVVI